MKFRSKMRFQRGGDMKRSVVWIIGVLIISVAGTAHAFNFDKRYKVKSFIAEYTIEGSGMGAQNGTEKVYVDNYGAQEARYSNMSMSVMGFNQNQNSVTYLQNGYSHNFDYNTQRATKLKLEDVVGQSKKGAAMHDYTDEMIKQLNGKRNGKDNHLGFPCDIVEFSDMGSRTCIHDNVPLWSEVKIMGIQMSIKATSFQKNVKIPRDKIDIPGDIVFQDVSDVLKGGAIPTQLGNNSGGNQEAPNMQDIMKQFTNFKNNPEYQEAMRQQQEAVQQQQQQYNNAYEASSNAASGNLSGNSYSTSTNTASEDTRSVFRKSMDGMKDTTNGLNEIKSTFGNIKSLFGK